MKGKIVFLFILALAAAWLLADIGKRKSTPDYWQGYVEDDTVLMAPTDTARIKEVMVERGDSVKKGDVLFTLTQDESENNVALAKTRVAEAKDKLENLMTGKRPEEISVVRSDIDNARATLRLATEEFNRKQELYQSSLVSARAVDSAKAALDQAQAKLASVEKQAKVASMPARAKEIEAAEAAYAASMAEVKNAEIKLKKRVVSAPADGLIEDVIRHAGEIASPSQPAVLLLPQGARKIRFFVPEAAVAKMHSGQNVSVACDGCGHGLQASISYISPKAEYTPPVIYSVQSREKLVFMVEAIPENTDNVLRAGIPVDIRPVK